jgi:hypothetical protein
MKTPHNTNPAILKQKIKENSGAFSWNDLADKPFGEEIGEVDILVKDSLAYSESEQMYMGTIAAIPEVGKNYTVIYNGTDYDTSAVDFGSGIIALGNLGAIGQGENTGEPFIAIINPSAYVVGFLPMDGAQEFSLEIKGFAKSIKQLDEKFYHAPCVYYIKDGDDHYLYKDALYQHKVSFSDFLNSKLRPMVVCGGNYQYQPVTIFYKDAYGEVVVANAYTDGGMAETVYYTAEYSG